MTTETLDLRDRDDVVLDGRQVCVIDDDELYRAQISLLLAQKNLKVVEAADTVELQAILDRRMPDCLLLDYNLMSENGLFVLERLRQRYASLAPVVMVSGDETQKTTLRAFRAGVADFVPKRNLRLVDLAAAVHRAITLRIREEVRAEEVERLRRNAQFDELSGLFSRAGLEERLAIVADTAERQRRPYGLAVFHVARIGEVQDRFGVVAADRVLRAFGQKLRDLVAETELRGSWARGTFLFAFPGEVAPEAFERLVNSVAERSVLKFDLAAARLTLSVISAHAVHPDDGGTLADLLGHLEERLEEAKRAFARSVVATPNDWVHLPESETETSDTNRRREPRMRVLKRGTIYLNGLQSTIDCTIRNQSSGGAGLRLMAPTAIPEFFRLKISDSGDIHRVRKCWHVNNDIGVAFMDE